MPDLLEGSNKAGFIASVSAAVNAANGVIPDEVATPEPEVEVQPEPEVEAEAVAEAEPEPAAEPDEPSAAERLLAGRFKTTDELERGYQELLARFDTQGAEVGELRKAFEERFSQIERDQRRVQVTPDLISENPAAATQIAYEQGDEATLRRSFEVWRDEDPFAAAAWATTKQAEMREAKILAELEQVKSQVAATQAPLAEQADEKTWQQAWALAEQETPGIRAHADEMFQVAPQFADAMAAALSGPVEARAKALKMFYEIARGRNADNLTEAVTQAARETAEETAQAKADAFVASQTAAVAPETRTAAELETERMRAQFAAGQERRQRNWNIG